LSFPETPEPSRAGDRVHSSSRSRGGDGAGGETSLPGPLDFLDWSVSALTGVLRAAATFVPGAVEQTREIQNQLHAVEWFAFAGQRVPLPSNESLPAWLGRVDSMDLDHRPWAAEGAAFHAARREFGKGPRRDWLHGEFPEWSLTVLHTGLGMALADLMLENIATEQKLAEALAAFTALCIVNSRPGYEGCALESIGLAARNMHSSRVPAFNRLLAQGAPELREFFWHGYGRGSYLSPANLAPWSGSGWRAIQAASAAAPDPVARRNAVSGASWAFTLVNLRTPAVMAAFLREHGEWALSEPAFADGVRSGLAVWRQLQAGDPAFQELEKTLGPYICPVERNDPASRNIPNRGAIFRFGS